MLRRAEDFTMAICRHKWRSPSSPSRTSPRAKRSQQAAARHLSPGAAETGAAPRTATGQSGCGPGAVAREVENEVEKTG